ncbi:PKD domain-containing protein [Chondrinema litorale]|uniref:Ig-like domain-containing protein n=1 Tax=Chondrinema litorale TaxID=2994555 RepID=UPI0025436EAD|nr:PKD domain-containing protein [Chondrinema litorale]UZR97952.1 PKD domain-containing protein [Chondrinema litorale]
MKKINYLFLFAAYFCLHFSQQAFSQVRPDFAFEGSIEGQSIEGLTEARVEICTNLQSIDFEEYVTLGSSETILVEGPNVDGTVFTITSNFLGENEFKITYTPTGETLTITLVVSEPIAGLNIDAGGTLLICNNLTSFQLYTEDVFPKYDGNGTWFFINDENSEKYNGLINQESGEVNIEGLPTGQYTLQYYYGGRCNSDTRIVYIVDAPEAYAGGDIAFCEGDYSSLDLNTMPSTDYPTINGNRITEGSNINWRWTSDNTTVQDNIDINELYLDGIDPGTYTLTLEISYDAGEYVCTDTDERTITIGAIPATPNVVEEEVSICGPGDVTLSIERANTNLTYEWYEYVDAVTYRQAATNAALEETGESITLEDLAVGEYQYIVYAVSENGCYSSEGKIVTIYVNYLPGTPQVNQRTDEICIGETVTFNAVLDGEYTYKWYSDANKQNELIPDEDYKDGRQLTYQFDNEGTATVYVTASDIETGCEGALASASVLVNPSPAPPEVSGGTYCEGEAITLTVENPDTETMYYWYIEGSEEAINDPTVENNGSSLSLSSLEEGSYTYYVVAEVGECSAQSEGIDIEVNPVPAPPEVSGGTYCEGEAITLTVENPDTETMYYWYIEGSEEAINDPTVENNGSSLSLSSLEEGSYTYYVVAEVGECSAQSEGIDIEVNPVPAPPEVSGGTYCEGEAITLTVENPDTETMYYWYIEGSEEAINDPTVENNGSSLSLSSLEEGSYTYYVVAEVGECSAQSEGIDIEVNPVPAPPEVSGGTYCEGEAITLTVENPDTETMYYWYIEGSEEAINDPTVENNGSSLSLSSLEEGSYTYYVVAEVGECSAQSEGIDIEVNPVPAPPEVSGGTYCEGEAITLTVENPDTETMYYWYVQGSEEAINDPTGEDNGSSLSLSSLEEGSYTYYVVAEVGECSAQSEGIDIEVNPVPETPEVSGGTYCEGEAITLTVENPDTETMYYWYVQGSEEAINDPTGEDNGSSLSLSSLEEGSYTYYVVAEVGECSAQSEGIDIEVNPVPETPEVSGGTYCEGEAITLTVENPDTETMYYWYVQGSEEAINDPTGEDNGSSLSLSSLEEGSYTYYVVAEVGECSAQSEGIDIEVNPVPETPEVSGGTYCEGEAITLTVENPDTETMYYWYVQGSEEAINDPTVENNGSSLSLSSLEEGSYTYYVVAEVGECSAQSEGIDIEVNPVPAPPEVSGGTYCEGEAITLTVENPDTETMYYWYVQGSEEAINDPTVENNGSSLLLTSLAEGSYTYYVVAEVGECSAQSEGIDIEVNPSPAPPEVSGETYSCGPTGVSLSISEANDTYTYQWYSSYVSEEENELIEGASTSLVVDEITETTTYYVTASSGDCVSEVTTVTITIDALPAAPEVSDVTVCLGELVSLEISNLAEEEEVYYWYTDLESEYIHEGTAYNFTPGTTGTTTYYVQAVLGDCVSEPTEIQVTVTDAPSKPEVSGETYSCGPTGVSLSISEANDTYTYQWYSSYVSEEENELIEGASTSLVVDEITETTTYYVTASSGDCVSEVTTVTITIDALPAAPEVSDVTVCLGELVSLEISNLAEEEEVYYWYTDLESEYIYEGTAYNFTPETTGTTTYYVQAVLGDCVSEAVMVTVTVTPIPAAPTLEDIEVCEAGEVIISPEGSSTNSIFIFYADETLGESQHEGSSWTTTFTETTDIWITEIVGDCESEAISITINVEGDVISPVLEDLIYCGTAASARMSVSNVETGYEYYWYAAATADEASFIGIADDLDVEDIAQTTSYWVEARTSAGCVSELVQVSIIIESAPATPEVNDVVLCGTGSTILEVIDPSDSYTYEWYINLEATEPIYTGTSYETGILEEATTYYVRAVSVGETEETCVSEYAAATVSFSETLEAPTLEDIEVCEAGEVIISPEGSSANSIFRFYADETLGESQHEGSSWTTTFTETADIWITEIVGDCESEAIPITINVEGDVISPVLEDLIYCGTAASARMSVSNVETGYEYYWYAAATADEASFIGIAEDLDVEDIAQTTSYWVEARTSAGCVSELVQVSIIIESAPATPEVNDVVLCGTGTALLEVIDPSDSYTYEWFTSPDAAESIYTGVSYQTASIETETAFYVRAVSASSESDELCSSVFQEVLVMVLEAGEVSIGDDIKICFDAAAYNLWDDVAFSSGVFTGEGIENNAYFNPETAGIGSHEISFAYTSDEGCEFYGTREIEVTSPLNASEDLLETFEYEMCLNAGKLTLANFVLSEGGTWSGTGVSDGKFDPLVSGVGTFDISYTYSQYSCTYTAILTIDVTEASVTTLELVADKELYCPGEEMVLSVVDASETLEYLWYNSSGALIGSGPSLTTAATSDDIYCKISEEASCAIAQSSIKVNVVEFPDVIITDKKQIDQHDYIQFSLDETAYNLTFEWDFGTGESSTQPNPAYYYHGNGEFVVTVVMTNTELGCIDSLKTRIQVGETDEGIITDIDNEIVDTEELNSFKVYPQPFKSYLELVYVSDKNMPADIEIFNVEGKFIKSIGTDMNPGENTIRIITDEFPSGMYLVKIMVSDSQTVLKALKR